jgi:hypothetical protein
MNNLMQFFIKQGFLNDFFLKKGTDHWFCNGRVVGLQDKRNSNSTKILAFLVATN